MKTNGLQRHGSLNMRKKIPQGNQWTKLKESIMFGEGICFEKRREKKKEGEWGNNHGRKILRRNL